MKHLYNVIVSDIKRHENKEVAREDATYHKYEGYNSYGIRMPVLRSLLKQNKQGIEKLNCADALVLAQKFYASHIEEQILSGNYVLQLNRSCLTPSTFGYLDKALDHFMSWSTVDDLCVEGGKVLQPLLLEYPRETIKLLEKWNGSKNMWKRRASVVPFTRKIGESGKFTNEALRLCDNLIWDKEDLVQKAVGWCLKDIMRGDKQKVLKYIRKIRAVGVPATITLYAIRELKGRERQEILNIK